MKVNEKMRLICWFRMGSINKESTMEKKEGDDNETFLFLQMPSGRTSGQRKFQQSQSHLIFINSSKFIIWDRKYFFKYILFSLSSLFTFITFCSLFFIYSFIHVSFFVSTIVLTDLQNPPYRCIITTTTTTTSILIITRNQKIKNQKNYLYKTKINNHNHNHQYVTNSPPPNS